VGWGGVGTNRGGQEKQLQTCNAAPPNVYAHSPLGQAPRHCQQIKGVGRAAHGDDDEDLVARGCRVVALGADAGQNEPRDYEQQQGRCRDAGHCGGSPLALIGGHCNRPVVWCDWLREGALPGVFIIGVKHTEPPATAPSLVSDLGLRLAPLS